VPLCDWLDCLQTPVVQVYADGCVLIDSGVAGYEHAYRDALARIDGTSVNEVRLTEILLTHGHENHTGSAVVLAKLASPRAGAGRRRDRGPAVITGDAIACMAREPIVGAFASIPPRRSRAFGASRDPATRFRARPELRPLVLVGSDAEEVDVEFFDHLQTSAGHRRRLDQAALM
jgi:glyoxylase-like metal-dependent hydrolase (beta-lactamase superfamily II)